MRSIMTFADANATSHGIIVPRSLIVLCARVEGCGSIVGRDAGFLYRVAVAEYREDSDYGEAEFYEEFAAVEPVYREIFQCGVGEEAVPEEGGGGDVDGEVERFPEAAAEADAEVGSNDYHGDTVEGDGADGIFEGLAGGVYGVEEIEGAELCGFVEEENDGMQDGERERCVSGEIVQAEIVKAAMRPLAHGAVAEDHQGAEQHVEGDGAYGG